jgi:DNA-binding IclR family transcriptional regulator
VELLGAEPDNALLDVFETTRRLSYAVSEGEVNPAATSIASSIFELDGTPAGAIVVTAPRQRVTAAHHEAIGKLVLRTARDLSRGMPEYEKRKTP